MQRRLDSPLFDEERIPKNIEQILRQYWPVLIAATDSKAPVLRNAAILPRPKTEILTALKTAFRCVRQDESKQAIERAILGLARFVDLKELPADQKDQLLVLTKNRRELQTTIDSLRRPQIERYGVAVWLFLAAVFGLWIISVLLSG
jgi:hypothetical protein